MGCGVLPLSRSSENTGIEALRLKLLVFFDIVDYLLGVAKHLIGALIQGTKSLHDIGVDF